MCIDYTVYENDRRECKQSKMTADYIVVYTTINNDQQDQNEYRPARFPNEWMCITGNCQDEKHRL